MFSSKEIFSAKSVSIAGFLKSLGIEALDVKGGELRYFSPIRQENTASFYVSIQKNTFIDFGGSEETKGDVIRLVQILKNCGFQDAVKCLLSLSPEIPLSFSFSGHKKPVIKSNAQLTIKKVCDLKNPYLIRYIESRRIPIEYAMLYLKEVHYQAGEKYYFAIGFPNDSNGFELRNGAGFKGKTINDVTTIEKRTHVVNVFEGFFDFLSALVYYGSAEPAQTTIIMNTTANFKKLKEKLPARACIKSFLDNDAAGENVVARLVESGFCTYNYSSKIYPGHKDFNEYLIKEYRNGR
ncbi:toprim domain-containing protein [Dyadobacter sp.]|uniref:toprim domain-containing protein n=1 Tax=Dyadobacter sp. TaxID=1914288 RepID=UPI003F7005A3